MVCICCDVDKVYRITALTVLISQTKQTGFNGNVVELVRRSVPRKKLQ